jgi:hypothetical protein
MGKMSPVAIGALLVYLVGAQMVLEPLKMSPVMHMVVWALGLFIFLGLVMTIESEIRNRRRKD